MPAAKRGGDASRLSGPPRRSSGPARTMPRHYVVFRCTTQADGSNRSQYEVPGQLAPLDDAEFAAWRAIHAPLDKDRELISVLVIREVLDRHGSILTCSLERRRGSPTGKLYGEPARVTFAGPADQVRLYRATAAGKPQEIAPDLDQRPPTIVRRDHFAGEDATIRAGFGTSTQILSVRGPTLLEELVGLTTILHIRAPSGIELDCGMGWHGTTPFLLRADFPRFESSPALPAADAAAIALAAVAEGMTTYESRIDAQGPAVTARSVREGSAHLIRPDAGGVRIDVYTPAVPPTLLNPDQATWLRYASAHEGLVALDGYPDGRADGVFILTAGTNDQVTRHLIDADGVEVWRTAADDTLAAALYRERVIGRSAL